MHRSHWDIEVYAKDFQERRWREAEQRRMADQAAGNEASSAAENSIDGAIARLLNAWMARFDSTPPAEARHPVAEPKATANAEIVSQPQRSTRGRLAQPYADMIVIARGTKAGVVEQPSVVSDC